MDVQNNSTPVGARAGFAKWSPCAKCCSIFSCCAVVFLVVMIPVANFVIVPKMAQSTMDRTDVSMPNSTMVLAADFFNPGNETKHLMLVNEVILNVPGPLGAKIHAYKATLKTEGKEMGYFEFPELDAQVGLNSMNFSSTMTVTNNTNAITFATLMMTPGYQTPLEISGDPDVTAIVFTSTPHQDNKLTCTGEGSTFGAIISVTMRCAQGGVTTTTTTVAPTKAPKVNALDLEVAPAAAAALAALPDCSKTACPAKCACGTKNCADQISSCLADTSCAAGETCAMACPCGSMSCLAGCAAKHPSAKGFAVLSCVSSECPGGTISALVV